MTSILIEVDIGDAIVLRGTLTDEAGDPVVGADVTALAIGPGDSTASDLGTVTDEGAGVYSAVMEPATSGLWEVRMESAAPNKASAEGVVYVRESRFS